MTAARTKTTTPARKTTPPKDGVKHTADTTTITFRGQSFSFPNSRAQWPTMALQRFQRDDRWDAIEILLGPEQWYRLNQVAPLSADFAEFFGIFAGAANAALTVNDDNAADEPADADS